MNVAPQLRRYSSAEQVELIRRGLARVDGDTIVPTVGGGALLMANDAEAQASGTAVAADGSNTGDANSSAFSGSVTGSGMTLAFDSVSMHGSGSYKLALTGAATVATYAYWQSFAGLTTLYGAFYIRFTPATIASTARIIHFKSGGANGTLLGGFALNNGTQGFHWRTAADASSGNITPTVAQNTWYRVEFQAVTGGVSVANVYSGDSTTALGTCTSLSGALSAGSIDTIRYGVNTANFSSTSGDALYFDDLQINDSGFPGPGPYTLGAVTPPALPLLYDYPPRRFGPF